MAAEPRALLRELRPRQWTKNLILAAPLIFSGRLHEPRLLLRAVLAVLLFCLLSSAVYIFNDLRDLELDRRHPLKRSRPLAAGELSRHTAVLAAIALLAGGLIGAWLLQPWFALVAVAYLVVQAAYLTVLKHVVILDVMAIATGFVLRVAAGAVIIRVAASPWLLLCSSLLALFLALVKRRDELFLSQRSHEHRAVLQHYTAELLDQMIGMIMAATIVSYSMYTFLSREQNGQPYLMLTIPFVVYGLLRYLFLMHQHHLGGQPEDVLLSDGPLVADIVAWTSVVVAVLYIS